jgi:alkaline phosphatase D
VRGADASGYYPQSVASGAPRSNSVILWTRVWDETLPTADRQVALEVATDSSFGNIVFSRNDLQARFAHDHCVKLKVTGLQPYTTYYYRFNYLKPGSPGPNYSHTGRTKTAPADDQNVPVRFAFLSCQDFIGKYYNSLFDLSQRHRDSLDFVFWCGDYVYETSGNPEFQVTGGERGLTFRDPQEAIQFEGYQAAKSLSNYRDMYRVYRRDIALQRVHELFPMIITWDDHEFSDDNHGATASFLDEKRSEFDPVRKRNSEQAFLEYMPVDNGMDGNGVAVTETNLYPNWAPLYSNWRFGRNCEVILTDFRSYRPDHLVPESAFPGEVIMTESEAKAAMQAIKGWSTSTIDAQWPTLRQRFDAYDPNFNPESTFGLAVQAAVVYWYQENEGLSYAEAVGVAKEKVKSGRLSAGFVNLALNLAGFGVASYSEADLASFPRGLSYAYLLKVLPYGPVGSRYALINDLFNCYAWKRWQETGGASENVYGDRQTQWLHDTLSASTARWKYVVDSTSLTPMLLDIPTLRRWVNVSIPSLFPQSMYPLLENQVILNADAWDGFPNERERMLDLFAEYDSVVLSGDIHSTWVTRHRNSTGKTVPEFTGTSVSSGTVTEFLDNFAENAPELTGIVDIETVKSILKPLFLYSDQFATSDSEIVDCELGSNGYMVVEATHGDMRVLRHEISDQRVTENYYDDQFREVLSNLFKLTEHRVYKANGTLVLEGGVPLAATEPYNRAPSIREGAAVTVNLTQNNYPSRFELTIHAEDEDSDPLTWRLLEAPRQGEAELAAGSGGLSVGVSYQPGPNFTGIDSFLIEVSDPRGGKDTIRVYANVGRAGALDLWRWHYFSALDPSGNDSSFWDLTADPDGDRQKNLEEFALGGRPIDGLASSLETATSSAGSNVYAVLRFLRRKDASASGLTYRIQTSTGMDDNWTNVLAADVEEVEHPVSVGADYERVTLRFRSPLADGNRFFRLFIEYAPAPVIP